VTIKNNLLTVTAIQKLLSIFFPIKIDSAKGTSTPEIKLYYFQGRWQLSAATALYSDGPAYQPLQAAFKYLKKEIPNISNMLVLGAGLGSAVEVLAHLKCYPSSTLVEIDPQITHWGEAILRHPKFQTQPTWICQDVRQYVQMPAQKYDLVVLDIFEDRHVPAFVGTSDFLIACKNMMRQNNGILVFNYIINQSQDWNSLLPLIQSIYTVEHMITIGINRILILRNNV
jgi:spermidine synthase